MSDFVIEDGVLLSYTGTDYSIYVPDFTTEIAPDCFKDARFGVEIYLPPSIKKLGKNALGSATVYAYVSPCVRDYMFQYNHGRLGQFRWYDKEYFKKYWLLRREIGDCKERLKQIEELTQNSKKNKTIGRLSVILSLVVHILLWRFLPWFAEIKAWLGAFLPPFLSKTANVILCVVLWVVLCLFIFVTADVLFGESYYQEEEALKKKLKELNPRYWEMIEYMAFKDAEMSKFIYGDSQVKQEKAPDDGTWYNGLPWTANYDNAKDV